MNTVWLIERWSSSNPERWLTPSLEWTDQAVDALHFCRQQDAVGALQTLSPIGDEECSATEHMFVSPSTCDREDFKERFLALHNEAKGYGFSAVTVLLEDDPLAQKEWKWIGFTNGHMVSVGMLEYAKQSILAFDEGEAP